MSRHASLRKDKEFANKQKAPVISIRKAGKKKENKQEEACKIISTGKSLFNHERIFKAKKHDPL